MSSKKYFKKKRWKSFLNKQCFVLLFGLFLFFPLYSQANECSSCGKGFFNFCEEEECYILGECYFEDNATANGCYECDGSGDGSAIDSCNDYGDNQLACQENPCDTMPCYWNESLSQCETANDGNATNDPEIMSFTASSVGEALGSTGGEVNAPAEVLLEWSTNEDTTQVELECNGVSDSFSSLEGSDAQNGTYSIDYNEDVSGGVEQCTLTAINEINEHTLNVISYNVQGNGLSCQDSGGICINEGENCEGETQLEGCSSGQVCCIENNACQDAGGTCINEGENCQGETQLEGCSSGQVCCIEESGESGQCPEYEEGIGGGFLMLEGHLVPCGRQCDDPGTSNDETATCTLCHFFILMKNVFDLVLSLIIICSILAITIGGVLYILSTGNSGLQKKGKEIVQYTLTAFALLLLSWLIVYTLLNWLGAKTDLLGNGSNWFEFECDTESSFETGAMPPQQEGEPDETDYTFQSEIESQYDSDASGELKAFLTELKPKLPAQAKEISSISDNAGMESCIPENYSQPPCAHTKNSCHYGGQSCIGKSYAVDFANESYYDQIKEAVEDVEPEAYIKYESNHVHVSIGMVNGCGCN
jgi:hypothetical protein